MQPIQPISERFPALEEQEIILTYSAPAAKVVQVAGTFNGWSPEANRLEHLGSGQWEARLMLKAGQYEYRFMVDGVWADDPQATDRSINPHGGLNSVLRVAFADTTDLL
jgi:1,4-alpha-glucan branching enzyme